MRLQTTTFLSVCIAYECLPAGVIAWKPGFDFGQQSTYLLTHVMEKERLQ